jgi:hypothetical protein
MFKKLLPLYLLALVVISLAFIYGCGAAPTSGGGGGGGISGREYYGMNSMGGTNKCTINDTAFSLHFESGTMEGLTISGNVTTLESGLLSCETTSSSDPTKISTGDVFYVYEVTNEVLVIGAGPNDHKVIMILPALSNTAPFPLAGSYESITIPRTDWILPGNREACMTGEFTGTDSYTFAGNMYYVGGGFKGSGAMEDLHFTGGRLCTADAESAPQFFFSPKGMFVVSGNKEGGGWKDGGAVGAIYDSTVSTPELATDKCYIGMSFARELATNNSYIEMISVESVTAYSLDVYSMEASSGAALGSPRGTITLGPINTPGQGIIDATISSIPAKMVAYKYNDSGKYAVCGFVSMESDAMTFFAIEQ